MLMMVVFILNTTCVYAVDSQFVASKVLMVPPLGFKYNPETAVSNRYQKNLDNTDVRPLVMGEFRQMVDALKKQGIDVLVFEQPANLPDAVFPNNWFSTQVNAHGTTDVIIYPMLTPNRQAEVNPSRLMSFLNSSGVQTRALIDLRNQPDGILEGTGSMVLDKEHKIIYASLSERTNPSMVKRVASLLGGYQPVVFNSADHLQHPIYHTNVMMGLGHQFAVVCLDCIKNPAERGEVVARLKTTGKIIIPITQDQVNHMCGNVLELVNKNKQYTLVMSQQAFDHFTPQQRKIMAKYDQLLPVNIKTIETVGGGSARCMMAEIYT
jgi:hypothetical protein